MKKKNRKLAGKPTKRVRNDAVQSLAESSEALSNSAVATLDPTDTASVADAASPTDIVETANEIVEAAELQEVQQAPSDGDVTESDEAPSSDEASQNEEASPSDAAPTEEKLPDEKTEKRKRILSITATALLAALGLFLTVAIGIFSYVANPYASEIGSEIRHPAASLPFCEVEGLDDVDTDTLGVYDIKITFFGFFSVKSHITVRDTVAPSFTTRPLAVTLDTPISPEDFVVSASDMTDLSYEFVGDSRIRATDEGGNSTTQSYSVTYVEDIRFDDIEAGTPMGEVADMLEATGGLAFSKLPMIDTKKCGVYKLGCRYDGMDLLFALRIVDTTAPLVTAHPIDLLIAQTPTPEMFITDISDVSDTYLSFAEACEFDISGLYDVIIVCEDEYGNRTEFTAQANVLPIASSVTLEAGSDAQALGALLAELVGGAEFPKIPSDFAPEELTLGKTTVELIGENTPVTLELVIEDTTPPVLTLQNTSVLTGKLPRFADLVADCTDASPVKLEFTNLPDTTVEGTYTVTVSATDSSGNTTEQSATLRVSKDSIPPVIYGVKSITAYEGASVSYKSGVYAADEKDGAVAVSIDTSRVNPNVAGVYTVTYTAADSDGNVATKTASVTVLEITDDVVYRFADEVLASITSPNMSARQKARAIYDWCRNNIKYSTSTSHLMGYFNKAAYSGFTRHYGNCYTYYAVASALLTRAGIENTVIYRDSTTNPHYWNLVKMDGEWYHLDTCPQPAGHRLEVFLLKDAEVRAFTLDYYYSFNASLFPATPK